MSNQNSPICNWNLLFQCEGPRVSFVNKSIAFQMADQTVRPLATVQDSVEFQPS